MGRGLQIPIAYPDGSSYRVSFRTLACRIDMPQACGSEADRLRRLTRAL